MGYEKQIKSVSDNKDKQQTYSKEMARYSRALKEEFYLEAMLITYAILEDRLKSFLYYLAVTDSKESKTIDCKRTKEFIRKIVFEYSEKKRKTCKSIDRMIIKLSNISDKIEVIKAILIWIKTNDSKQTTDKYQSILKCECERLYIDGILYTFEQIDIWCRYRNEVIHGLMNKNTKDIDEHIADRVREGMNHVKYIAGKVQQIKKRNKMRKVLGIDNKK